MAQETNNTSPEVNEVHSEVGTTENASNNVFASIGLNTQLFVVQLINFTIVIIVVWFLILKPLTKKMEERKKIIDESLDKAKEVETNLKMSELKYQDKLDEAKAEANKIIEKSKHTADELSVSMQEKAKVQVQELVLKAKVQIADEKQQMLTEAKGAIAGLVVAAVEKITQEKMDEKKDAKYISGLVDDIAETQK